MHTIKPLLISFLASAALALPVGGFIGGMVIAQIGKGTFLNHTIGRLFIGVVYAVMNTLYPCRPTRNEGLVGAAFNFTGYTAFAFVILFIAISGWMMKHRTNP